MINERGRVSIDPHSGLLTLDNTSGGGLVYRLNWTTLYKHTGMGCRRSVKGRQAGKEGVREGVLG